MKKTPISASKHHLHRLLKPYKPPSTTHLRRLSVAPGSPQPPSQELPQSVITQLTTTDDWTSDTNLNQQILSLSPQSIIKISRQFETSSKALKFFHFIRENPSEAFQSLHPPPLDSVFQTVIELAIREGDYASIVSLFNLSKDLKVSLTPNSAVRLINYFSRVKKVQDSVSLYDALDPDVKTTNVRNTVLNLLLKSERFEHARQLLDEMLEPDAKFFPNEITLNIVFDLLLRWDWVNRTNWTDDFNHFIGLIPKFGTHGVHPDKVSLTQFITKLCRSCRTDNAWGLLHELMRFGNVEAAPCNALISGLAKVRDYKKINLLLQEMKENEIKPNVVTYGLVVNHLCKSRRVDEALDMFKKMTIKPDVILYNTIIDGLCKVGRQEEGLALMKQMQSEDDCIPNVITYNCLIDGFCKSGEIERAQELVDEMKNEGVDANVVTVNTLVDGMCKHGRISNGLEFFRKMQEEKGIKGNAVTYSTLISAFCNVNNIEKAMNLFEEMESIGSPDALAYYSLISGLTLAGRPDDASVIATKMKKAGFEKDLVTYNTLIGGFCRKKKLDKAVEVLKEMEENGVKADGVTYNTLISYFSQNGDFETAHKFLKQMVIDGNVPTVVTYGTLIHAYCLAGNLDEALDIFEEMLISSKVVPNTVIYNILIESLCKRGKIDHALSLMDGMLQKGVKPNTTTYNAMLKGLSSKNRLHEGLRVMDQMTNQGCNPDYVTLEILNEWLDAVGEIEKLRMFVQGYQVSSVASTT